MGIHLNAAGRHAGKDEVPLMVRQPSLRLPTGIGGAV